MSRFLNMQRRDPIVLLIGTMGKCRRCGVYYLVLSIVPFRRAALCRFCLCIAFFARPTIFGRWTGDLIHNGVPPHLFCVLAPFRAAAHLRCCQNIVVVARPFNIVDDG